MFNYKIVETDNYNGDYPDETFVNIPSLTKDQAQQIADTINSSTGPHSSRYWKVVTNDYKLQPGFHE